MLVLEGSNDGAVYTHACWSLNEKTFVRQGGLCRTKALFLSAGSNSRGGVHYHPVNKMWKMIKWNERVFVGLFRFHRFPKNSHGCGIFRCHASVVFLLSFSFSLSLFLSLSLLCGFVRVWSFVCSSVCSSVLAAASVLIATWIFVLLLGAVMATDSIVFHAVVVVDDDHGSVNLLCIRRCGTKAALAT